MVIEYSELSECPENVARPALALEMTLCAYKFLDVSLLKVKDMMPHQIETLKGKPS